MNLDSRSNEPRLSDRRRKEYVSLLRSKGRRLLGQFIVEGFRGLSGAVDAGAAIVDCVASEEGLAAFAGLLARVDAPVYVASPRDLAKLSAVETTQGLVAAVRIPDSGAPAGAFGSTPGGSLSGASGSTSGSSPSGTSGSTSGSSPRGASGSTSGSTSGLTSGNSPRGASGSTSGSPSRILILDGVQDPGNVGTLIRTAAWFGVKQVVSGPGTADVYAPKVVRASMGGLWDVALQSVPDTAGYVRTLRDAGTHVFAAVLDGESIHEWAPQGDTALVLGSEAHGVSEEALAACTGLITIPPVGMKLRGVESLNVGAAGAVLMALLARVPAG